MKPVDIVYGLFSTKDEIKNVASDKNVAVVIFLTKPQRCPIIFDVTGISNVDKLVANMVSSCTIGCNYRYELVHKIDNIYFYE